MSLPNLKRIKIASEQELDIWLAKYTGLENSVLLVTHCKESHSKYVSREQVAQVLQAHSWTAGMRYTIGSDLLGHVISRGK